MTLAMTPQMEVFVVFALMAGVWSGICIYVFTRGKAPGSFDAIYARTGSYRRYFLIILVLLVGIVFAITLFYLPYAPERAQALGPPTVVVNIVGIQWAWNMSTTQVPSGVPVEFNVTSHDVNHDFGVYNSQGVLIGQVQALPGYSNHLIMVFDQPGAYTVRCLDFCGIGHAFMIAHFTVT